MESEALVVPPARTEARQITAAICLCFFLTGSTGLIYEVLWTRMLGLVFGHTVFAITTVLAAFMAGLGLGSLVFGPLADRTLHLVRLYGVLEAGIGAFALFTPLLFGGAEAIYIPLHKSLHLSFFAFSLAQFLLIFLILLIPATLMGASLPVLSRFFVHEVSGLGKQVGRLYALNTFGAVLGTYAAGFHLIPTLGLTTTLQAAAVVNLGIGMLAVVFDRHLHQLGALPSPASAATATTPAVDAQVAHAHPERWSTVSVWLSIAGLGISGAASMMYEVAWTRALALTIGSSTYAFSTMLVTFLTGLALGSALFARFERRLRVDPLLFGYLQLGIGVGALFVAPFFDRFPELFLWAFQISQSSGFVKVLQFVISVLAMLLPTLFMGATFPCVAQIGSRGAHRVGHDIGRIYFVNTSGAIAGTILAGFVLIPTWGLQPTIKIAVSLNLCLALALCLTSRQATWRRAVAAAPALALIALFLSPAWDPQAMTSGVAIYGRHYFRMLHGSGFREAVGAGNTLLYYKDGISATVSVHRTGDIRYLRVNGKTDASSGRDMHTQLMSGHLPMLFHPAAKHVLVIGLGSGVTAGAVALHPVERVDAIEIEPAVVEGSVFFEPENRSVLKHPKVRLAIADGRNFLLAAERPYDVITSEPSNPWMRGIGNLFSQDFYELAARRLTPEGILCQWLQTYNLYPEDLKMVVKTFRTVFPHVTIWNTTPADLLLIGSKAPVALDARILRSRYDSIPELREDLGRLGFRSPLAVLADFVLNEEDTARYSQHGWVNTDDLPLLEFSAPEGLYADTIDLNRRVLWAFRSEELPRIAGLPEGTLHTAAFQRDLGLALWAKGFGQEALARFEEAVRLEPRDPRLLVDRGRAYLRGGSALKAEADFKAALQLDPRLADAHQALVQLYRGQKMWEPAETHLQKLVALQANDPKALADLADLKRERRQSEEAIRLYRAALAMAPRDARLWTGLGFAHKDAGRPAQALEAFREALAMDTGNALVLYQVGLLHLAASQLDQAEKAFQDAARKDPRRSDPHIELGRMYAQRGEKAMALEAFRRALRLDPTSPVALEAVEGLAAASASGS
jgi:spermidine synthase